LGRDLKNCHHTRRRRNQERSRRGTGAFPQCRSRGLRRSCFAISAAWSRRPRISASTIASPLPRWRRVSRELACADGNDRLSQWAVGRLRVSPINVDEPNAGSLHRGSDAWRLWPCSIGDSARPPGRRSFAGTATSLARESARPPRTRARRPCIRDASRHCATSETQTRGSV
jgi:hypothetical protein